MRTTIKKSARSVRAIKIVTSLVFVLLAAAFMVNAVPRTSAGNPTDSTNLSGPELFAASCARCHGADGTGGKGPNLASEKRQAKWRDSDEKLIRKITNGGMFMPSFGKKLKPEEIKAIADHVRTLKE